MYEVNSEERAWARAQMTEAAYPQAIQTAVERLLEVWWTMNHTGESSEQTLDGFGRLARGHALFLPQAAHERWMQVKPGNIVRGEIVRVRSDAYPGVAGREHNMRRGRVVAIRNGDVIVKYDDGKLPQLDGVHHSPYKLEKLV